MTASLVGWVRSQCRNGKGQALVLGLVADGTPVLLLDYVLVDPEGPAADVDVDKLRGSAVGSPAAKAAAVAQIDKFRADLQMRGFKITAVQLGAGIGV